jgi:hypothetical protein
LADLGDRLDTDVTNRADLFRRCVGALVRRAGDHRLLMLVDDAHKASDYSARR